MCARAQQAVAQPLTDHPPDAAARDGRSGDGSKAISGGYFSERSRRLQAVVARAAAEAGTTLSPNSSSTSNSKGLGGLNATKLWVELRKQFPKAHLCKMCGCGPVEHGACTDLQTHPGEKGIQGEQRVPPVRVVFTQY